MRSRFFQLRCHQPHSTLTFSQTEFAFYLDPFALVPVNKEGIDYIKRNFQYSILENYNAKVDDSVILERESWWKETLQSRKFGYNAN